MENAEYVDSVEINVGISYSIERSVSNSEQEELSFIKKNESSQQQEPSETKDLNCSVSLDASIFERDFEQFKESTMKER